MSTPDTTPANAWLAKLQKELARDKKKTFILLTLGVICLVTAGRLLLPSAPQQARGAPAAAPGETPVPGSPSPARNPLSRDERREQYVLGLDRTVKRDLFKLSPEYFAPEGTPAPKPDPQIEVDQAAQSRAAAELEETQRVAAIRVQAQGLSLQSTMAGAMPSALINGQLLHVEGWIGGFQIKAIGDKTCVVVKDGVDVSLTMK